MSWWREGAEAIGGLGLAALTWRKWVSGRAKERADTITSMLENIERIEKLREECSLRLSEMRSRALGAQEEIYAKEADIIRLKRRVEELEDQLRRLPCRECRKDGAPHTPRGSS